MKIAIISDTHDNLITLNQALEWIKNQGIKRIIHCGDVCKLETLAEIAKNFEGKIEVVTGNADEDFWWQRDFKKGQFKNVKEWGEVGKLEIKNSGNQDVRIGFAHYPEKAKELAGSKNFDIIFYGHSHKPWEEKIENCQLVNSGTLAGMFNKATFAVYDTSTKKLELKVLGHLNFH